MEEKIIGGEIRTTKEGYKIIKPILDTLGILINFTKTEKNILAAIRENPDITQKQLAAAIGITEYAACVFCRIV